MHIQVVQDIVCPWCRIGKHNLRKAAEQFTAETGEAVNLVFLPYLLDPIRPDELGEGFRERQERTLAGARILAERLSRPDVAERGISVLTGGTDVHLVLVDLRNSSLDGRQGEDLLAQVEITINRNAVPFDPRPPMVTSGLRIGTPALATRGFDEAAFTEVADIIAETLIAGATDGGPAEDTLAALRDRVHALASAHPLYPNLDPMGA